MEARLKGRETSAAAHSQHDRMPPYASYTMPGRTQRGQRAGCAAFCGWESGCSAAGRTILEAVGEVSRDVVADAHRALVGRKELVTPAEASTLDASTMDASTMDAHPTWMHLHAHPHASTLDAHPHWMRIHNGGRKRQTDLVDGRLRALEPGELCGVVVRDANGLGQAWPLTRLSSCCTPLCL